MAENGTRPPLWATNILIGLLGGGMTLLAVMFSGWLGDQAKTLEQVQIDAAATRTKVETLGSQWDNAARQIADVPVLRSRLETLETRARQQDTDMRNLQTQLDHLTGLHPRRRTDGLE